MLFSRLRSVDVEAQNKIEREIWNVVRSIKDKVTSNLYTAFSNGQLKIDPEQYNQVVSLVVASIDEMVHNSSRALNNVVIAALDDHVKNAQAKKKKS